MADIGASVLARLRNKAKETGRSNQLCMQLFCQEEFLRRLEKSKYADNFILKGGLFLYTLTEFDSRVTVDVDFMLRRIPNTPEKMREVINEIISSDVTNDYIMFEIKNVSSISVNKQYPGIHADIVARIKNTRTPFGIDFGIGDVIVPGAKSGRFQRNSVIFLPLLLILIRSKQQLPRNSMLFSDLWNFPAA